MTETPTPAPTGTATPNIPDYWPTPAPYEIAIPEAVPVLDFGTTFETIGPNWAFQTIQVWQMGEIYVSTALWLILIIAVMRGMVSIYRDIKRL